MRYSILVTLFSFISVNLSGQGMDFFEGTYEEAFKIAEKQEKIVFVDAFTTWCGPCKRMAKNVFPQDAVGEFYNKHFVNMKIDMEKEMGLRFGKTYRVSAYPTFFFISPDGEIVHRVTGGRDVEAFILEGEKALQLYDRSGQYVEAYEAGNRDYDLVYNYIKALNQAGKSSLKVSNDYLYTQSDITTEDNIRLLHEAVVESDSRLFNLYVKHKKHVLKYFTASEYELKILSACRQTVDKAVSFQSRDLLESAQKQAKKYAKASSKSFKHHTDYQYAVSTNIPGDIYNTCKTLVNKEIGEKIKEGNDMIDEILAKHTKVPGMLDLAETLAKDIAKQGEESEAWLKLARVQIETRKYPQALKSAEKAKTIIEANNESTRQVEGVIRYINSLIENQ